MQFRTAAPETLAADSPYKSAWTISNLRRGLFGTLDKRDSHAAAEECCTYAGMRFFPIDSRYYEAAMIVTAVTVGRSFDTATSLTVIIAGRSLEGRAPSDLPGRIINGACAIVQNGTATNTEVNVAVSGYSSVNNYRKIEYSTVSDLSGGVTETVINGFELANFQLPPQQTVTTTSLSIATTKYIAISHSPDGINWSPRSNIIAVVFGSSGGTGGGDGDTPPTFTSIVYDSANSEADLFAKNGTATGAIELEYKLASDSVWTTHGTTFAHGATSGSLLITEQSTALVSDVRLKQVGVSGYSTIKQVTVDAAAGGGTPPSSLGASATEVADCEWSIELSWVAGSGSSTYTVEQKLASGSWVVLNGSVSGTSYLYDTVFGEGVGRTRYYRVKQNDVTGYSNTANVYVPRCT